MQKILSQRVDSQRTNYCFLLLLAERAAKADRSPTSKPKNRRARTSPPILCGFSFSAQKVAFYHSRIFATIPGMDQSAKSVNSLNSPIESDSMDAALSEAAPGMRGYWFLTAIFLGLGLFAFQYDFLFASPDNLDSLPGDLKRVFDLSEIFAHGFGIVLIAVGIWNLVPEKRRFVPRIICCAMLPAATVQLVKVFFGRNRPVTFLQPDLSVRFPADISETWQGWMPAETFNVQYMTQSFPSGHTATVCGLAIGLGWVFPRGRILFFSVALLATMQRVTSLAHWSSDVCFGAAIAFMMAGALTHNWGLGYWLGRFENRSERRAENQAEKNQIESQPSQTNDQSDRENEQQPKPTRRAA